MKKNKHPFLKYFSFLLLRFSVLAIKNMPLPMNHGIARCFGCLAYRFSKKQRDIALKSMAVAFPTEEHSERVKKIRNFFVHMIGMPLETIYFIHHPDQIDRIDIEGEEHLKDALSKGRGVIGLTAHMGNFPLMHLALARLGYPVSVMTRPMRDVRAGEYFDQIRKKFEIQTIYSLPRRDAVKQTITGLRQNRLVIMQMDQDFGSEGVLVDFFDQPASTPVGPIVFAQRTQAPLIPMLIVRKGLGQQCIKIFPEIVLDQGSNQQETLKLNARKYNLWLETWIRQYPDQWGWIHRRWKG